MALRKRTRELKEVNMSSMTDIIFFLLIFFMLTSTLVKFHTIKLPESQSRAKAPIRVNVDLMKDGKVLVQGAETETANLDAAIREAVAEKTEKDVPPTVTIAAEIGVEFKRVAQIMALANKHKAKAILATEPRE